MIHPIPPASPIPLYQLHSPVLHTVSSNSFINTHTNYAPLVLLVAHFPYCPVNHIILQVHSGSCAGAVRPARHQRAHVEGEFGPGLGHASTPCTACSAQLHSLALCPSRVRGSSVSIMPIGTLPDMSEHLPTPCRPFPPVAPPQDIRRQRDQLSTDRNNTFAIEALALALQRPVTILLPLAVFAEILREGARLVLLTAPPWHVPFGVHPQPTSPSSSAY